MSKKNVFTKAAFAALATAAGAGVVGVAGEASAQDVVVTQSWNGTVAEARAGEARFRMRGRFQYDVYSNDFDVGTEDGSRSYVRRAFLGVAGRLTEHWRYKVDFVLSPGGSEIGTSDFCRDTVTGGLFPLSSGASCPTGQTRTTLATSSGGGDDIAVDDAYLEYAGDFYSLVIGEHNVTAPLEDRTSSLDTPFNERSALINAFGYGRAVGVGLVTTGANWMAAVAVQGDSLNNQDNNFSNDELTQYSGRFTWAPLFETSPEGVSLVHLGAHARYRYVGDDSTIQYRSRPFLGRGSRPLDVGASSTVRAENDTTLGVEAAVQFNQFGATVEWATLDMETPGDIEGSFDAFYADVFLSLTGEPRNYRGNSGSFGAIAPRNPVTSGGWGHWMLGARYESVSLDEDFANSSGVSRSAATIGEQTGWGVGLDWVPIDHVRFKLNYAVSDFEYSAVDLTDDATVNPTRLADQEVQVISLRTQFDF